MTPRSTLTGPIQSLLATLVTPNPISTITSTFTTQPAPIAHEHGLQQLAPFLGRTFTGIDGISEYFDTMISTLEIKSMKFEPESNWLVDDTNMAVCLRGTATFIWRETGQSWDETFVYRVALARDTSEDKDKQGRLLVSEYQVWADTGAAYLARIGGLPT
ncbi:uncharacterized protein N7484_007543 [Penicillium longicatenatum]|uniref:uncharacterized protein n=1 Tax=Penicillium longicatenatum TaxID=1561947 RepID=UPI002548AA01|nr:uncharacterized protein N7484_007543 [Penicillium longicatenatum]KAJ5639681.1 hypothetical protein N7484_007543 [Penicillium longicatenatum]